VGVSFFWVEKGNVGYHTVILALEPIQILESLMRMLCQISEVVFLALLPLVHEALTEFLGCSLISDLFTITVYITINYNSLWFYPGTNLSNFNKFIKKCINIYDIKFVKLNRP
jgi:hypothetical protein